MSENPTFLEIATPLIEVGYAVLPLLGADGKSPEETLGNGWQNRASSALEQVKLWAQKFPTANVGILANEFQYNIDFDDREWFMEATGRSGANLTPLKDAKIPFVITPRGVHLHIKGLKPAWAKKIPNPKYKKDGSTPEEKPFLVEFPTQVVGPGSHNFKTGLFYGWLGNPLDPNYVPNKVPGVLPEDWLKWLQSLYAKDLSPKQLTRRPLRPGLNLKEILDGTELAGKYKVVESNGKVFYNYHRLYGKCLIEGEAHWGQERNDAQCGFYHTKENPADWGHFCFATNCQIAGSRRAALAALSVDLNDVLRPACRDLLKSRAELDQRPLDFVVDRFIQEEGITGIGGCSGHGKTYIMLSLAKHISLGTPAFGFLKTKQFPILYLLAEGGDRALLKRLKELHIYDSEDFLMRTMSQGPTLALNNPGLVEMSVGRVVFLDTSPRWLQGREENSSTAMAGLFQLAQDMLSAGAVAIVLAQHSIKGTKKSPWVMHPDCVFRGSGDIIANMAAGHGVYQLDNQARDRTLIHIECVKPRDFEPLRPFQLEGKPWIREDLEGDFRCVKLPGECGYFETERREYNAAVKGVEPTDARLAQIQALITAGKTHQQIADELDISKRTVANILGREKTRLDKLKEDDEGEDEPEGMAPLPLGEVTND